MDACGICVEKCPTKCIVMRDSVLSSPRGVLMSNCYNFRSLESVRKYSARSPWIAEECQSGHMFGPIVFKRLARGAVSSATPATAHYSSRRPSCGRLLRVLTTVILPDLNAAYVLKVVFALFCALLRHSLFALLHQFLYHVSSDFACFPHCQFIRIT